MKLTKLFSCDVFLLIYLKKIIDLLAKKSMADLYSKLEKIQADLTRILSSLQNIMLQGELKM